MRCYLLPIFPMKIFSAVSLCIVLALPASFAAAEEAHATGQSGLNYYSSAEYGRPFTRGALKGTSRLHTGERPSARSIDKKSKVWKNGIRSVRENQFESLGIPQRRNRSRFKREGTYQKQSPAPTTAE